jgi:hypothetical protein
MRTFAVSTLFVCFAVSAFAQTQGVIVCQGGQGVPAWEKPGSIVEIKHLRCGENIAVMGSESGYTKIRINEKMAAFVNAKYVRVAAGQIGDSSLDAKDEKPSADPQQTAAAPATVPEKTAPRAIAPKKPKPADAGLELGIEISPTNFKQFNIQEETYTRVIMKESGTMVGTYGRYTLRPSHYMARLEGTFSLGTIDCVFPDPTYPQYVKNISNFVLETRELFGRDFPIFENAYLMPFAGFGYRYRYDGMGGKRNGFGGFYYDRKSHYFYSPLGAEARFPLGSGWHLKLSGEYDLFWHGLLISEIKDINSEATNMVNDQSSGWGARGSLTIARKLGKIDFAIEPFLRYWHIRVSEAGEFDWPEPDNKTREWGIRFGVKF